VASRGRVDARRGAVRDAVAAVLVRPVCEGVAGGNAAAGWGAVRHAVSAAAEHVAGHRAGAGGQGQNPLRLASNTHPSRQCVQIAHPSPKPLAAKGFKLGRLEWCGRRSDRTAQVSHERRHPWGAGVRVKQEWRLTNSPFTPVYGTTTLGSYGV
jgi:hypothetical protein